MKKDTPYNQIQSKMIRLSNLDIFPAIQRPDQTVHAGQQSQECPSHASSVTWNLMLRNSGFLKEENLLKKKHMFRKEILDVEDTDKILQVHTLFGEFICKSFVFPQLSSTKKLFHLPVVWHCKVVRAYLHTDYNLIEQCHVQCITLQLYKPFIKQTFKRFRQKWLLKRRGVRLNIFCKTQS